MTERLTEGQLLAAVLDENSFESWDEPIDRSCHPTEYQAAEADAEARAATNESVLTGRGLALGRDVAVIVGEFRFLGGSIGVAAATRITRAVRRDAPRPSASRLNGIWANPHGGRNTRVPTDG